MRSILSGLACLAVVAACGGGPAATGQQPTGSSQPTQAGQPSASAQPTQAGQPSAQPGGSGTVAVTLTGGDHAGSYTQSGEANCTHGFVGENVWGVQFSLTEAEPNELSSVQLVYREGEEGDGEMFGGVQMLLSVGFDDLLSETYVQYDIEVRTDGEDDKGTGTVEVTDSGATAVIHATGTTAEGVVIDATVNYPSVMRG